MSHYAPLPDYFSVAEHGTIAGWRLALVPGLAPARPLGVRSCLLDGFDQVVRSTGGTNRIQIVRTGRKLDAAFFDKVHNMRQAGLHPGANR